MILKLKEKKKADLKDSIYLIKKKLKKQLSILMMKWINILKNFIILKKMMVWKDNVIKNNKYVIK